MTDSPKAKTLSKLKKRILNIHRRSTNGSFAQHSADYHMDFTLGQYDIWRLIIIEACAHNDWTWRRQLRLVCRVFDKIIFENRATIANCYRHLRILKFRNKIKFNDIQMGSLDAVHRFLTTELRYWRMLNRIELDIIDMDMKTTPLLQRLTPELFDFDQILIDVAFNIHSHVQLAAIEGRLSPIGQISALYPILTNHCCDSLRSLQLTSIKFADEQCIQEFLAVLRQLRSLEKFGVAVILQQQFTRADSTCGDIVAALDTCTALSTIKLSIDDTWNVRSNDLCNLFERHDIRDLTVTSVGADIITDVIFEFPLSRDLHIDRLCFLERLTLSVYHVNTLPDTNASTLLWQTFLLSIARHCINLNYLQLTLETYTSRHSLSIETFISFLNLLLRNAVDRNVVVRLSPPLLDDLHKTEIDERLLQDHEWDPTCRDYAQRHLHLGHSFQHLTISDAGTVEFCTTHCRMVETRVKRTLTRTSARANNRQRRQQSLIKQSWLERIVSR